MAKSNLKKLELEAKKKVFLNDLYQFMESKGHKNFDLSGLKISFDCEIVTDDYCSQFGLKRKRVKKDGVWKCYCVL